MSSIWRDLKFAARLLIRSPAFTGVAVLALALGIGANCAVFSVTNALLLRPLPFEQSHRLVYMVEDTEAWGTITVSYPNFMDWRDQNHVLEDLAAHRSEDFNLTGTDRPERLLATMTSPSLFRLLRVEPFMGRIFLEEEDDPGAERVAMLSHGLWQRRFGSDPDIIGKTIALDEQSHTIVGITPPGFFYPLNRRNIEIYVPIGRYSERWRHNRGTHPGITVTGRLKPDVSLEEARADLNAVAKRLEQEYPENNTGHSVFMGPLQERLVRQIRPALMVLLAAVSLVLLIACANVANLLLARASARSQEIALRTALGAGRTLLLRQLLTESVLLSFMGGASGLVLAFWGVRLLLISIPGETPPIYDRVGMDAAVLGFATLLSLLTGVVFGAVPALQASKADLVESLGERGRTSSTGRRGERFRGVLVVAEVALALMLLVSAALVIQSFFNVVEEEPGFNPESLLAVEISLPTSKYPEAAQQADFYRRLEKSVAALPAVHEVGLTVPFLGGWQNSYVIEGQPPPPPGESPLTDFLRVNNGYFRAMQIPVLKGRLFTDQDREDSPRVAVIDETFAEKHWPNEDPIGKRIKFGIDPSSEMPWMEVVGVVRHVKSYGVDRNSREEIYLPYRQDPERTMTLLAKTMTPPHTLAAAIRKQVQELDADQPVFNVRTVEEHLRERLTTRRVSLILLSAFALIALLLASVGVYGVIAYAVTQRTHEIGVRMAMGARAGDVLKMVMRHGMGLAGLGLTLGVLAAVATMPFLANQLFGVEARDPWTLLAATLLLATVALLASFVPARRAARLAPVIALRYH